MGPEIYFQLLLAFFAPRKVLVSQGNDLRTDLFDRVLNLAKAQKCVLSVPILCGTLTSSSTLTTLSWRRDQMRKDSKWMSDGRRGELELHSSLS